MRHVKLLAQQLWTGDIFSANSTRCGSSGWLCPAATAVTDSNARNEFNARFSQQGSRLAELSVTGGISAAQQRE
jgi:hypothetical protein